MDRATEARAVNPFEKPGVTITYEETSKKFLWGVSRKVYIITIKDTTDVIEPKTMQIHVNLRNAKDAEKIANLIHKEVINKCTLCIINKTKINPEKIKEIANTSNTFDLKSKRLAKTARKLIDHVQEGENRKKGKVTFMKETLLLQKDLQEAERSAKTQQASKHQTGSAVKPPPPTKPAPKRAPVPTQVSRHPPRRSPALESFMATAFYQSQPLSFQRNVESMPEIQELVESHLQLFQASQTKEMFDPTNAEATAERLTNEMIRFFKHIHLQRFLEHMESHPKMEKTEEEYYKAAIGAFGPILDNIQKILLDEILNIKTKAFRDKKMIMQKLEYFLTVAETCLEKGNIALAQQIYLTLQHSRLKNSKELSPHHAAFIGSDRFQRFKQKLEAANRVARPEPTPAGVWTPEEGYKTSQFIPELKKRYVQYQKMTPIPLPDVAQYARALDFDHPGKYFHLLQLALYQKNFLDAQGV